MEYLIIDSDCTLIEKNIRCSRKIEILPQEKLSLAAANDRSTSLVSADVVIITKFTWFGFHKGSHAIRECYHVAISDSYQVEWDVYLLGTKDCDLYVTSQVGFGSDGDARINVDKSDNYSISHQNSTHGLRTGVKAKRLGGRGNVYLQDRGGGEAYAEFGYAFSDETNARETDAGW